jgi:hypothetical protein
MADGDGTSSGVGMGMIIGLLLVVILMIGGGFYFFGGGHVVSGSGVSSPTQGGGTAISGSATVK